jgi:hypothetical protein
MAKRPIEDMHIKSTSGNDNKGEIDALRDEVNQLHEN